AGLCTGYIAITAPLAESYGAWIPGLPTLLAFRVDSLSSIFLLLLAVLPPVAAINAAGLGLDRRHGPLLLLLTAAMTAVVTAADWVVFLLAWELMTLASYLLVLWDWRSQRSLRAGWTYLLTTHVAGAGILLAATALSLPGGSYGFDAVAEALRTAQPGWYAHLLVGLLALAFATKGAVYPFSFWLPEAYGVAPAPASALFAGLMAKMGLYGLIRLFVFMLPSGEMAWGIALATLGAASMLVGNLRAMSEQEAGRLVAQSSIGQIGYVLLALGIAVSLKHQNPALATLAFAAAIYHLINHSAFKALLFLTVGAIQRRTGTQDLRRLGGLAAAMPGTAVLTLLGALAIAGTPPLNGFASKWLIYRAAVFGGQEMPLFALYALLAIFLSTVSLAAYLKYFGTAFLGPARPYAPTREMWLPQAILGAACVALGLWPRPVVNAAIAAYGSGSAGEILGGVLGGAAYQPLMVLAALALGALLTTLIRTQKAKQTTPWLCGESELEEGESRYGSSHLYVPFLARFALLLRPWLQPRFAAPPAGATALDADRWLFQPIVDGFLAACRRAAGLNRGRIRSYLAWQLVTVLAAVAVLLVLEGGRLP
ncbi:MAG TPA: proton-conducting transporter membrane subunit, partial [Symbiobacteriaceae bacterium]|nr:proton-conducting transporter membrane subunit [Symbiobacteriaceae bacterium]